MYAKVCFMETNVRRALRWIHYTLVPWTQIKSCQYLNDSGVASGRERRYTQTTLHGTPLPLSLPLSFPTLSLSLSLSPALSHPLPLSPSLSKRRHWETETRLLLCLLLVCSGTAVHSHATRGRGGRGEKGGIRAAHWLTFRQMARSHPR